MSVQAESDNGPSINILNNQWCR